MPGVLYHIGASANCPHGGQISVISSNLRVLVSGMPVATLADNFPVAGCAFNVSGKPQPCVTALFVPATRVFVSGSAVILQPGSGICQSAEQAPQGPPIAGATQTRVSGI
jgi:hypothetical protein